MSARFASSDWTPATHPLGRGRFDPANVEWGEDGLRLILPAGRLDGAEVSSLDRYAAGVFRARIRAADAPGSLTAFFLYEGVPGERNDEVDVEILGDSSRRVLLTTWADGVQTNAAEHVLPFDPRAAPHEYAIELHPGASVRFTVDGTQVVRWAAGIPSRPMQLRASAWWPSWLAGGPPIQDAQALISDLTHLPG